MKSMHKSWTNSRIEEEYLEPYKISTMELICKRYAKGKDA